VDIKALLFDLGGVLVDWDGITPLTLITDGRLIREKAQKFWQNSPSVKWFETGQCSDIDFALGVTAELNLSTPPDEFLVLFESWDKGPFPGAQQLIDNLSHYVPLYCLSNNNPIHWRNKGIQELLGNFCKIFVSFEIGLMKPDPAAFQFVSDRVVELPEQILFLDDNIECVRAAQKLGFNARQAVGLDAVERIIRELGLGTK
jgi:HAD superfamily hydrolase (TIGR01509 family)